VGALNFENLPHDTAGQHLYEPDPANRALYDERFGNFRDIHHRLAPLYRRLNAGRGPNS
jgi:xylulokinase